MRQSAHRQSSLSKRTREDEILLREMQKPSQERTTPAAGSSWFQRIDLFLVSHVVDETAAADVRAMWWVIPASTSWAAEVLRHRMQKQTRERSSLVRVSVTGTTHKDTQRSFRENIFARRKTFVDSNGLFSYNKIIDGRGIPHGGPTEKGR